MLGVSGSLAPAPAPTPQAPNLTRKAWLALSLSVVSSGLSTGVCLVKWESNWLTSSSDCCGRPGGRVRGVQEGAPGAPTRPPPTPQLVPLAPYPPPTRPLASEASTHQGRPERGVHTAGQEVIPINVPEEGVPL